MKIENNYVMKMLPENVTTEMDGLRKVYIINGNLTSLPNIAFFIFPGKYLFCLIAVVSMDDDLNRDRRLRFTLKEA